MQPGDERGAARRLLRRVRDVMAGAGGAEARLDQVVVIIAGEMVAEVCSVYILRAGEVLELFATRGLNPDAVHRTRLRVGEGLVGDIAAQARPLALADAQAHPAFAYRPETGEESFASLMGAPILRGGRVLGVLVVQNRTQRDYHDEDVEALETVAMVLAELVAGGELLDPSEILPADGNALLPLRLEGLPMNPGLAIGVALLHRPRVTVTRVVAEDPGAEIERLEAALVSMRAALGRLLEGSALSEAGEHRDVLETYRMFAEDRGWVRRMREAVDTGLTAEAAVQKVQNDTRARMHHIADEYLRERLHDLDDLANRLLRHLTDGADTAAEGDLPDDTILIARSMGPAELLDYDRRKLRAVVIEESGPTAHVAIIARALDIPMVGKVRGILEAVEAGEPVIVDGDNAQVFIRPGEDVRQTFVRSLDDRAEARAAHAALRDLPAETLDGTAIDLNLNAGLLADLQQLDVSGAGGVGLYRTEIPFMVRASFPDVAEQAQIYRRVLALARGKPVTFRTLDIGGDKVLPYFSADAEENPAMGWRAIRIGLDQPAVLRRQFRALIEAADGGPLRLMLPMIAEVAEFDAARAVFDLEFARAETPPSKLELGAMFEVPSLFWQLPALLERVDFISVGSNDLVQFLFASDRGNQRMANRYDVLSPVLLRGLRQLVESCDSADVPLAVCGEMAGEALEAMALIGLGVKNLSMAPPRIGPVKAMVRSTDMSVLRPFLQGLCDLQTHSLREVLRDFARDHGIET